jgi:hypothetical protein
MLGKMQKEKREEEMKSFEFQLIDGTLESMVNQLAICVNGLKEKCSSIEWDTFIVTICGVVSDDDFIKLRQSLTPI